MTHIAIQEAVNGRNADWLEQVSDEQYGGRQEPRRGCPLVELDRQEPVYIGRVSCQKNGWIRQVRPSS